MEYWLGVLQAQIPTVMEKAIASENHTKGILVVACITPSRVSCEFSKYEACTVSSAASQALSGP